MPTLELEGWHDELLGKYFAGMRILAVGLSRYATVMPPFVPPMVVVCC